MEAIPVAVRRRILTLYEQGKKTRHISEALGYCVAAVRRVRQHFRQRGTLVPQTHLCGRTGHFTPARKARLLELLQEHPDATLAELCRQMDRKVALSTMDNWIQELRHSYKKKRSTPRSRTGPTSRPSAPVGLKNSPPARPKNSYLLMNRGSRPT